MNKKENMPTAAKVVHYILDALIILVILISILIFGTFASEYRDYTDIPHKNIMNTYIMERPAHLAEFSRENKAYDPKDKASQELYALGDYFDASYHIRIAEALGDSEQIEYWTIIKGKSVSNIGDNKEYFELIDTVFNRF